MHRRIVKIELTLATLMRQSRKLFPLLVNALFNNPCLKADIRTHCGRMLFMLAL
jgi:hypothetical protein